MRLTNAKFRKKLALINVTKSSAVTQDNDLARWCAALTTSLIEDKVPAGWFTTKELAAKLGKTRPTIARLVHAAVEAGRCEVKNFRVNVGRFSRSTPHYKLK